MRSCSDSIAQLAAALAKAQMELVNPVKCLTAVIDRWGTGNEGQSYRYAPLSAGLEIVRKTLCKHELAVIQTTQLDADSAMVLLTTTLAHGSGEWISATWPVCRTADMTNPKLMGAALTYRCRYGRFTLVGVAGEDDLDARELPIAEGQWRQTPGDQANGAGRAHASEPTSSSASRDQNAPVAAEMAQAGLSMSSESRLPVSLATLPHPEARAERASKTHPADPSALADLKNGRSRPLPAPFSAAPGR